MKIIHCFRSPVGGVFRHVRDLLAEQKAANHQVGIICDSTTGNEFENKLFDTIRDDLDLGLHRLPMTRSISLMDPFALFKIYRIIKSIEPDIVHSHSAKGGVYGRISSILTAQKSKKIRSFYCPHGGAMHYDKGSFKGKVYFTVERFLERYTDSLIFVSNYERDAYHEKVGKPKCPEKVVYNGLAPQDFQPVEMDENPMDFMYIGMMRDLKGPDIFLESFKRTRELSGKNLTAMFVGDGEDKEKYLQFIQDNELQDAVQVSPALPARTAFSKAKIIVVPSRAESFPYLVLEAMAAQKPIICTDVGGINEIFGNDKNRLIQPENPEQLADAMLGMINNQSRHDEAKEIALSVQDRFSLQAMASSIETIYGINS